MTHNGGTTDNLAPVTVMVTHNDHSGKCHVSNLCPDFLRSCIKPSDATTTPEATINRSCTSCQEESTCLAVTRPHETHLKRAFRDVIRISRVFGFSFGNVWIKNINITFIYTLCITCIFWAIFCLHFKVYQHGFQFGSELFDHIVLNIYSAQLAFVYTGFLVNGPCATEDFLNNWQIYVNEHQCKTASKIKRFTRNSVILFCMVVVLDMILLILSYCDVHVLFNIKSAAHHYLIDVFGLKNPSPLVKIPFFILQIFTLISWKLPLMLFVSIARGLTLNFQEVNIQFKDALDTSTSSDDVCETVRIYRGRHQKLCRLVKQLDCLVSLYFMSIFLLNIPAVCLAMYNFVKNMHTSLGKEFMVAWLVWIILIVQIAVITWASSKLTIAAKAPLQHLFDLDLAEWSQVVSKESYQVSIFVQRLTHTHIGLTAGRVFDVNMNIIFTLSTLILTYMFVLFNFGLALDGETTTNTTANTTSMIMMIEANETSL